MSQVAESTSIAEYLPTGPWQGDMPCPNAVNTEVWGAASRLHLLAADDGWQTPPQRFTLLKLRRHAAAHRASGFSLFFGMPVHNIVKRLAVVWAAEQHVTTLYEQSRHSLRAKAGFSLALLSLHYLTEGRNGIYSKLFPMSESPLDVILTALSDASAEALMSREQRLESLSSALDRLLDRVEERRPVYQDAVADNCATWRASKRGFKTAT